MNYRRPILYHFCRLLLGGLFLYAGVVKALDPAGFAGEIANYKILPYRLNFLVASTLPYVEMLAGLLLVVQHKLRPATLVIGGLNLVFMVALTSLLVRGLDIDCGCFRPGAQTSVQAALWRDAGLMVLAAVTFFGRGWRRV
ncbi:MULTISPECIES: MauE/DoxX family redox-associated membrane protein [Syntrophotalea]|jgi:hypothetical protein|uniref:DoxX family protein n=1 Tax=Syntrophotalea acetylenica TaxID=29542 RepID=A0A1L3GGJ6_SYNAC|nr:MauE/DoxX family redox-associated membrane protein [Syntrophotalea acetylenica]APG25082.1 DoxX family protein [Syntrophotalea acetylenica]APG43152.1 DoxX family protein [Syntrophotalea acetylenica]MDY0260923.1 MauE/DoxX family redox-associated membrane protein [Syntrophotalea acetylenica]